jgi:hypothetical protein
VQHLITNPSVDWPPLSELARVSFGIDPLPTEVVFWSSYGGEAEIEWRGLPSEVSITEHST